AFTLDLALTLAPGVTALVGPSGSGKTTAIRCLAGLERPDAGRIALGETVWFEADRRIDLPPQARRVGFVFQDYALFEHMTVANNIAFGLSVRKLARPAIESRVRELLARIQLADLGARYPRELSGGQRQRVALARALAPEPALLLLDEPFGALDARVRGDLRAWMRRLHDELHVTSVFVTHDQEEALEVADRIVVMNAGKVEQVGPTGEVFDRPASAFVMGFLGGVNVLGGDGRKAYVRSHDLVLEPAPGPAYRSPAIDDQESGRRLPVVVSHVRRIGVAARVIVTSDEHGDLVVEMPFHDVARLGIERGAEMLVHVRSARLFPDAP
ncbi:MAG TPA: sulfate/molybdate ABC transporter ATP-binding protein, partial [Kofleriaceae bacterium]|nr:sulfate/molybdate ABC transporter ATP-binding protein [Kofleriaceae bacterium]